MHGGVHISMFVGDVLPKHLGSELWRIERFGKEELEGEFIVSVPFSLFVIVVVEVTDTLLVLAVVSEDLFAIVVVEVIAEAFALSVAAGDLFLTAVLEVIAGEFTTIGEVFVIVSLTEVVVVLVLLMELVVEDEVWVVVVLLVVFTGSIFD